MLERMSDETSLFAFPHCGEGLCAPHWRAPWVVTLFALNSIVCLTLVKTVERLRDITW
jgi:hypothetical protein